MVHIRPLDAMDRDFLGEMLFEAFFWNPAWPRPTLAEFRERPEFTKLLADWGRPGDRGVVAEEQQSKIGAAWFRLWTPELYSYGFVGAETPELGIAVVSPQRCKGDGRRFWNRQGKRTGGCRRRGENCRCRRPRRGR